MEDPEIELAYLRWFWLSCDFGPAHGDVIHYMQKDYLQSGGVIPAAYQDESEDED